MTRVHSAAIGVLDFNPNLADNRLQGGRFDATLADPYPYLYAANDDPTAISETLLRDLSADALGARILPRARITGLQISWIRVETELELVSLRSGADLAAIGQDSWLTTTTSEYDSTRGWCEAIRAWAPWACGMTWRSLREPDGFAFIFFGDRCPQACFSEKLHSLPIQADDRELDSGTAHQYLKALLVPYQVALM